MKKVCMIVQDPKVKGGIAAVISGYRGSKLERDYSVYYVESYQDGSKWEKLIKAIKGYFHFVKVLLVDKPDLVHIHSSFGPSFYRKMPYIYMAKWWKLPVINHIHGSEFDKLYTNAGIKKQRLVEKVWGKCDRFIVLSEAWKDKFSCVISKEKMTVVENYSRLQPAMDKSVCNNQILFLGAINPMKGCLDMVDVIYELKKTYPEIKMVIAGDGEMESVKAKAKEKNVLENLLFPGWVRDKEKDELLKSSDIFFLPSYTEGMPMSILDAMGYGLPIISTNVGGIPKLVQEGQNGRLYTPGDALGMAAGIRELLENTEQRVDYGKKSREIVEERYSMERHLEKIEQVYESVF